MKRTVYSLEIADRVHEAMKQLDWHYRFDEVHGIFRTGVSTDAPMNSINIAVDIQIDQFLVYGLLPIKPNINDPVMMSRMAEFITRVNYDLCNGCFEMDYSDGELRYRCFVDCEESLPSTKIVTNAIRACVMIPERYAPGIVDILFRDAQPEEALHRSVPEDGYIRKMLESLDPEALEQLFDAGDEESEDDPSGRLSRNLSRLIDRLLDNPEDDSGEDDPS